MALVDISRIRNETVRDIYKRALLRGDYVEVSVKDAFGAHRIPILTSFIDENAFNAHARYGQDCYAIEVAQSVPLLLLLLFERLLSAPLLFPWIDAAGPPVEMYEVQFIVDPIDFANRERWDVRLTGHRSYAASTLADIMVAFCQMHELGHVLCGHVDANRQLTGKLSVSEVVEMVAIDRKQRERERAWETDADAVAVTYLVDHVADLMREARENEAAAIVFGRGQHGVEHVTSMVIVSLWALFSYVRGARYRLRRHGSHPHPLVRTYYVRDMFITAIKRRMVLDIPVLIELIDDRLEEMLVVLQSLGLSHNHLFDERYVDRVERERDRIVSIREKHRTICAPWAWFAWTIDG